MNKYIKALCELAKINSQIRTTKIQANKKIEDAEVRNEMDKAWVSSLRLVR